MQFFYQFPQRVERLVLMSSGGLGREVSPMLRTAALPGTSALLSVTIHPRLLSALWDGGRRLRDRGAGIGVYLQAIARALRPLQSADARQAFLHTLRSVIDVHGQRVIATDRLYLLDAIPTMIVWGERDHTIPLEHGRAAAAQISGSTFRTIPGAAHFPHLDDPQAVAAVLAEFIAATPAARIEDSDWASLLSGRSPRTRRAGDAAA
jgi:pimeloyl-ACP methyl ester carboxylesterase